MRYPIFLYLSLIMKKLRLILPITILLFLITGHIQAQENNSLRIAYVNMDSIFTKYDYAKEQYRLLAEKADEMKANLIKKEKALETEISDFNKKIGDNQFRTEEQVKSEHNRLINLETALQTEKSALEKSLEQEKIRINNLTTDSVRTVLLEYNKTANFQLILSEAAQNNILLAPESDDITDEILLLLNTTYRNK